MSKIIMSIAVGLALWFLILSGIEWSFNIEWLEKGKYYILIGFFVFSGSVHMFILNKMGVKK